MASSPTEAYIIGKVTDGAAHDLEQVTELAFRARYLCGLCGNNLLALNNKKMTTLDPLSPLGSVANTGLKNHYTRTKDIVQANSGNIRRIADTLREHSELGGATLSAL